jgi:hypothetical protein
MKTKPAILYLLFAICSISISNAQPSSQNSLSLCIAPGGLSATAITSSSATVNWGPVSRTSNYTVQYKLSSVLKWTTAATATTATSVTITGLAATTVYDWRVRNNCSKGSSTYTQSWFQTSDVSCAIATGLAASSVASTSATVSWAAAQGAKRYNLSYRGSGAVTSTIINGIPGTSYNLTGLTSGTTYSFQVQSVCASGSTDYSYKVFFTTPTSGGNFYCTSSGTTTYEFINRVALGSINNPSGNNNGYADFTGLGTSLAAGTGYTITLTPGYTGTSYREYWSVFIDYNQDGILNNPGEIIAAINGITAVSKTFTVPATAMNGSTRLRIVMQYASYRNNPCGSFTNGEVEDYTVNISGGAGVAAITAATSDDAITRNKAAGISIAPNPVTGSNAGVVYTLMGNGKTELQIINADGRAIRSIQLGNQSAGLHNYTLTELNGLSSGTYMLQLYQDGRALIRKSFMVVR